MDIRSNAANKKCHHSRHKHSVLRTGLAVAVIALGCTGPREYVHNGFKVGPNYCQPAAPVADTWIDANDQRVRKKRSISAAGGASSTTPCSKE